jgi:hypothetical protein
MPVTSRFHRMLRLPGHCVYGRPLCLVPGEGLYKLARECLMFAVVHCQGRRLYRSAGLPERQETGELAFDSHKETENYKPRVVSRIK